MCTTALSFFVGGPHWLWQVEIEGRIYKEEFKIIRHCDVFYLKS
jgi:hypothetical protein